MAIQATMLSFTITKVFLFLILLLMFIPRFLIIKLMYEKVDKYKLIDSVFINTNIGSRIYALINSIGISTPAAGVIG